MYNDPTREEGQAKHRIYRVFPHHECPGHSRLRVSCVSIHHSLQQQVSVVRTRTRQPFRRTLGTVTSLEDCCCCCCGRGARNRPTVATPQLRFRGVRLLHVPRVRASDGPWFCCFLIPQASTRVGLLLAIIGIKFDRRACWKASHHTACMYSIIRKDPGR